MWQFFWYGDPQGPDYWRARYDSLEPAAKARHDVVFPILETRKNWTEPHAKKLGDDLVEIILKGKIQHRLFGFYWPERLNFTVLLPCTHKDDVYDPPGAFETADVRIKELKNGRKWIRPCVRPQ